MKVAEKLQMDIKGLIENGPVNIVLFGDSITHGAQNGWMDYENVYWNVLRKKLNALCENIPINMINAGISGVSAFSSFKRIERDVLSHHPDLVVVSFGLNDINAPLESYLTSLKNIFAACKDCGAVVIFMTPNMLNTYVAQDTPKKHLEYAAVTAKYQNEGRMDEYIYSAVKMAKEMGVAVCDCYSEWKKLFEKGVDTTELLINRINHPNKQMHILFADMLYELIVGDGSNAFSDKQINTMYENGGN